MWCDSESLWRLRAWVGSAAQGLALAAEQAVHAEALLAEEREVSSLHEQAHGKLQQALVRHARHSPLSPSLSPPCRSTELTHTAHD